jgi:hypothetical protein
MSNQKRLIEFDDFISSKIEPKIELGQSSDSEAKLLDFSHIEISKIDKNIGDEITKKIQDIRQKLHELKSIL